MRIEVTKETFAKLFEGLMPQEVNETELAIIETYYNSELGQLGENIYNHVAAVWQCYLIDINA